MNSNLDLIVSALDMLVAMKVTPSPPSDHSSLATLTDLEQLLGYSMQHCAGLERVFADQALFLEMVEKAGSIKHTVSAVSAVIVLYYRE